MNDKDHAVRLLIDADLLSADEIGVHPCFNTASLAIATADILQKFLPFTGHTPTTVTLIGE
jgi:Ala-tRNA(Pro) deacylase